MQILKEHTYSKKVMNTVFRVLRALPAAAFLAAIVPVAAGAQPVPSYARPVAQIKGTISHFDGAYTMYVNDRRGFVDKVELHQGTIINPTGIRLEPGFRVTISGHADGRVFDADEIDTPYHVVTTAAYPAYPYPAYSAWSPFWGPGFGFGWGWDSW
jgi:hypothetical protein